MPKIEIVSLRFNLDKEEDNNLFLMLQKRAPSGKRSEFIKKIVSSALQESVVGGKSTARRTKEPPVSKVSPEARGPMQNSDPEPGSRLHQPDDTRSEGKQGGLADATDPETEAASLVGSLVQ